MPNRHQRRHVEKIVARLDRKARIDTRTNEKVYLLPDVHDALGWPLSARKTMTAATGLDRLIQRAPVGHFAKIN